MLVVPTHIGPSQIHGIGLFASQAIPCGQLVWQFDPHVDIVIAEAIFQAFPPVQKAFMERYAYKFKEFGFWILCGDNGRFFNHSDKPNTSEDYSVSSIYGIDIAARNIAAGEELTTNYFGFDQGAAMKLKERLS